MTITAAQVKELRDKTGAGMMDCKKALIEADGDFDKAIEILRKKGASVAAKRAERAANEGLVKTFVSEDQKFGIIVEVNCETDFVAKSDDFVSFSNYVLDVLKEHKPKNVDELLELEYDNKKVGSELTNIMGKIGEKIQVSRFAIDDSQDGVLVDYIHHGSKLGVLIKAANIGDGDLNELTAILKDIAMQVAAMRPQSIYRDEISQELIDKEVDIYKELARKEGKPENILDKIAQGRLNKFFQENCLVEQAFVKDNTKTVDDLVKEYNQKYSTETKLSLFHRFHLSDENK